ncbi:MerR family transcriptional regulator [Musicola paradisiaca]|uniref:Transcriptional regulator, MerR family n=1 Tax=Musicola paradisiaca (strain Ech703) TaxID=579405 RepID=C6C551_MUSP7|nr:MerR family transcriptional regulator [Musicola paradisiaca]ACS85661.1 transcriptional regulator, MerR family [Musicola paradisiaca Ech703]
MAYYSISEFSARCGVHAVTLRAWQRRYGLLQPKRTEGGHRLYDDEDLQQVNLILSWIQKGVSIGHIRPLLDGTGTPQDTQDPTRQETLLQPLQAGQLSRLRTALYAMGREYPLPYLVDQVLRPLRTRLSSGQSAIRTLLHLLDGMIVSYTAFCLESARKRGDRNTIVAGWNLSDATEIWLEALRRCGEARRYEVVPHPMTMPQPELFPTCDWVLICARPLSPEQQSVFQQWIANGLSVDIVLLGNAP